MERVLGSESRVGCLLINTQSARLRHLLSQQWYFPTKVLIDEYSKTFVVYEWLHQSCRFCHRKLFIRSVSAPSSDFLGPQNENSSYLNGILKINYKSHPYLIWISPYKLRDNSLPITMTEDLPRFIAKIKTNWFPASWLDIA